MKILFIAPQFFEYHKIIKFELEKLGHEVDYFDDRPSSNLIYKCVLRCKPSLLKWCVKRYFYQKILPLAKERKYDIVLVVLGQSFNNLMFRDLKREIPTCKFILYLWDSVKNFPSTAELSTAFDKTYSFDPDDCVKYDFTFLPLFYNQCNIEVGKIEKKYDVSFIGTIKKGKLPYLNEIKNQLETRYNNVYFYLYVQSKLVFLYNKIFNKEFKHSRISDFYYKKIPYKDNIRISLESDIVVDVVMSKQNGLSIRTFETLAYQKKLITNNQNIRDYDFYQPENIYIYDGSMIDFNNVFFKTGYQPIKKEIFEKYSLQNWIKNLLTEEENEEYERNNFGGWFRDAAVSADKSDE